MPTVPIDSSLTMHYEDDSFVDPWKKSEVILLIHGVAESSRAWFGWVPHLAREFRVLRPDQRGFGRSTVPPQDFKWSLTALVNDLGKFLDKLEIKTAHIVGAKLGGSIAYQFAAEYPERTRTLTVVSGPVKARDTGGRMNLLSTPGRIREVGVRGWAAATQRTRLGSEAPEEQIAWWTAMMGEADRQVCLGITGTLDQLSVFNILPRIKAPTLILTTDRSGIQSVESVRETQKQIPNSELVVIPSDSYHIAAARPDECAQHVLHFILRNKEG